jgi:WhiB family redox-sensing transcriptional regulator
MTAVAGDALDRLELARALLPLLQPDPEWKQLGLCNQVDPDLWFPDRGASAREPQRICGDCPVRAECLEYALETDQRFGIWGGTSEQERRRIKRDTA